MCFLIHLLLFYPFAQKWHVFIHACEYMAYGLPQCGLSNVSCYYTNLYKSCMSNLNVLCQMLVSKMSQLVFFNVVCHLPNTVLLLHKICMSLFNMLVNTGLAFTFTTTNIALQFLSPMVYTNVVSRISAHLH